MVMLCPDSNIDSDKSQLTISIVRFVKLFYLLLPFEGE